MAALASTEAAFDELIAAVADGLDERDRDKPGHTRRLAEQAVKLARAVGLADSELTDIRRGSLLHDIGKIRIPEAILFKTGSLSETEWQLIRQHPIFGYEMLMGVKPLQNALQIPYCHHEKWDGTGYPNGLKGTRIPLPARIFSVVDIWDALISERPYRRAWTVEYALGHMRTIAGTHLDPDLVKTSLESGLLTASK
jgi:putative nucleotidyltransferase with HDIG domain